MLTTQNPSEELIREYEDCLRDKEEAAITVEEFANDIAEKYDMPPGLDVDLLTGVFVAGTKAVGETKMSAEDRTQLWKIQLAAKKTRTAVKRCIARMRRECDAPNFAQLNAGYHWITPQGQLLVKEEAVKASSNGAKSEASPATLTDEAKANAAKSAPVAVG